jgi:ABC-2 type transport system permease protein
MFNLIKAELYKMSKMASVYISFLICCVSAVVITYVLYGINQETYDLEMSTNVSLLGDSMIVSLLGGVLSGLLIAGDFDNKNIHSQVVCGKGRFAIIMSKFLAFAIGMLFITLPYAIIAVIGFATKLDCHDLVGVPSQFIDVLTNLDGVDVNGGNIAKAILIVFLIIFLYIERLSICINVAFKKKKTIHVIIKGFVSEFLFDIIASAVSDINGVSDFFSALPYSMMTNCTLSADAGDIVKILISGIVYTAVMIGITFAMFRKDEIK